MKIWLKNNLLFLSTTILLFLIISFLVYQQIFTNHYASDTSQHVDIIYKLFYDTNYYISHPLWHLSSFYIAKLLSIPIEYGAIISSALYVVFWYILIFLFITNYVINFTNNIQVMIAMITILIGPLSIPYYHPIIFVGQGSPNIWHNVTLWTVRPFAFLSVWFILDGLHKHKKQLLIYGIIFTIISIFAKPSFIIMFLPSLLIYAIATKIYKDRYFMISFLTISLLSIAILLYQYTHTFNQKEGQIIIDFLGVWSLSSPNIPISIALALAFPLSFTLLKSDILNDKYILISWIMTFISIIYYATFAQSGKFYSHGNFGWSYMIAMNLLYVFTITKFFAIYSNLHILKKYILLLILISQIIIGIYYFIHILMGQNPIYIKILL